MPRRASVASSGSPLPAPPDRAPLKAAGATSLSNRQSTGDTRRRSASLGSLPAPLARDVTRPKGQEIGVLAVAPPAGSTVASGFGTKQKLATSTLNRLSLTETGMKVDPNLLINGEPWSTKWRPAPTHLIKQWGALGQKAKSIILCARDEVAAGAQQAHLSHCNLGDNGITILYEVLMKTSVLRNLNLQSNKIGDAGAELIAEAIEVNPGLQVLTLGTNQIGDQGACALARTVESHRSMMLLSLDSNCVGNVGACMLVSALSKNPRRNISCVLSNNPGVRRFDQKSLANLALAANTVVSLSDQGITLGQLLHIYATGVKNGQIEPKGTKTGQVCLDIVIPLCTAASKSYSQACVAGNPPPMTYVIHAWDGLFEDLVRSVASHASGYRIKHDAVKCDPNDPQWIYNPDFVKKSFFIDVFCVNQLAHANARLHGAMTRFVDKPVFPFGDPHCQIDKLHLVASKVTQRGGRILLIIDGDNLVYTRVQTLYELHHAIEEGAILDCLFTGLRDMPKAQRHNLLQNAGAATADTKRIILEEVDARPGGCEAFNATMLKFITDSARVEFEVKSGLREQKRIRTL